MVLFRFVFGVFNSAHYWIKPSLNYTPDKAQYQQSAYLNFTYLQSNFILLRDFYHNVDDLTLTIG